MTIESQTQCSTVARRTRHVTLKPPVYKYTRIVYQEWTSETNPEEYGANADLTPERSKTAILLHGALAHSRWWDHLAPRILATGYSRVLALDLTGHGDSSRNRQYNRESWATELLHFLEAIDIQATDTVIGHSMGGVIALRAWQRQPELWGKTVLVDSAIHWRPPRPSTRHDRLQTTKASHSRYFASPSEAVESFRLLPSQRLPAFALTEHIAHSSIKLIAPSIWKWKFDPKLLTKRADLPLEWGELPEHHGIYYIRGEESALVTSQRYREVQTILGAPHTFSVPGAQHHVILDTPDGFMAALNRIQKD